MVAVKLGQQQLFTVNIHLSRPFPDPPWVQPTWLCVSVRTLNLCSCLLHSIQEQMPISDLMVMGVQAVPAISDNRVGKIFYRSNCQVCLVWPDQRKQLRKSLLKWECSVTLKLTCHWFGRIRSHFCNSMYCLRVIRIVCHTHTHAHTLVNKDHCHLIAIVSKSHRNKQTK